MDIDVSEGEYTKKITYLLQETLEANNVDPATAGSSLSLLAAAHAHYCHLSKQEYIAICADSWDMTKKSWDATEKQVSPLSFNHL